MTEAQEPHTVPRTPAPAGGSGSTLDLQPPDYRRSGLLSDIMPAVSLCVGAGSILDREAKSRAERLGIDLEARVVVVALIDGLGLELLRSSWAYAPFLRSQRGRVRELSAGFPSTTANSLSSLGTGRLPGGHGVMGYRLMDPERGRVFNQLTWDSDRDPHTWVPDDTMFERLVSAGIDVVSLGEPKFVGRGLNAASLRGGRFRGSTRIADRVRHAVAEAKAPGARVIYFYWGGLDKIGHVRGAESWEWAAELEAVDSALGRLCEALPADATLLITADHGMVNIDHDNRIDLADHEEQANLLRGVGGEPRALHLYAQPGAQDDACTAFRELVGDRGRVMSQREAISQGWFGPVADVNRERIGDLIVVCDAETAIVDSRSDSPSALMLRGHHGGVSREELAIPLLVLGD